MKGSLYIVTGCMSCGKTSELIRLLEREAYAKRELQVFKSSKDTRSGKLQIRSRNGRTFVAEEVEAAHRILEALRPNTVAIGIDEIHFFDTDLLWTVEKLVNRGLRVYASGLDTDFRGEPFNVVAYLMAVADSAVKLKAVCVRCGADATRSQRLVSSQDRFLVGGDEEYEARCRDCHEVPR